MTQEDKTVIEREIKWRLNELQAMAEKYGIDNICIDISSDSVDVRFYNGDFVKLIGNMSKYNGEDEELKELYPNEWLTKWRG